MTNESNCINKTISSATHDLPGCINCFCSPDMPGIYSKDKNNREMKGINRNLSKDVILFSFPSDKYQHNTSTISRIKESPLTSCRAADRTFGINHSHIVNCCKGRTISRQSSKYLAKLRVKHIMGEGAAITYILKANCFMEVETIQQKRCRAKPFQRRIILARQWPRVKMRQGKTSARE